MTKTILWKYSLFAIVGCICLIISSCEPSKPAEPGIYAETVLLNFKGEEDNSEPMIQVIKIFNPAEDGVRWSASDNATWLSVTPASGNCTRAATELSVKATTKGLFAGSYTGIITLASPDAKIEAKKITVKLNVVPAPFTMNTFNSDKFKYFIDYPSTWNVNRGLDKYGMITLESPGKKANVMIALTKLDKPVTLKEYCEQAKASSSKNYYYKLLSEKNLTHQNMEAVITEDINQLKETTSKQYNKVLYIMPGASIYRVICYVSPPEGEEAYRQLFDQMINSFKIIQ